MKIMITEQYRTPWAWSSRLAKSYAGDTPTLMHLLDRLDKELSQGAERITFTKEELDSLQRPLTILKSHFNTKEGEQNEKRLWVCRLLTERNILESMQVKEFPKNLDEYIFIFEK